MRVGSSMDPEFLARLHHTSYLELRSSVVFLTNMNSEITKIRQFAGTSPVRLFPDRSRSVTGVIVFEHSHSFLFIATSYSLRKFQQHLKQYQNLAR